MSSEIIDKLFEYIDNRVCDAADGDKIETFSNSLLREQIMELARKEEEK